MTNSAQNDPPLSDFLDHFFAGYRSSADRATRARVDLVRDDLMQHMDEEGWRVLDPAETSLLQSEEQFRRAGAFARGTHASVLFCVLEHYAQQVHAQLGIDQRATQLDVIEALSERLWKDGIVTTRSVSRACRTEFDIAVSQGRSALNAAHARELRLARSRR